MEKLKNVLNMVICRNNGDLYKQVKTTCSSTSSTCLVKTRTKKSNQIKHHILRKTFKGVDFRNNVIFKMLIVYLFIKLINS